VDIEDTLKAAETLQAAGFIYDHERASWFNRSARKSFSGDAVRDREAPKHRGAPGKSL
jgi:hypothetical protein